MFWTELFQEAITALQNTLDEFFGGERAGQLPQPPVAHWTG